MLVIYISLYIYIYNDIYITSNSKVAGSRPSVPAAADNIFLLALGMEII
jgi:hypothetical protein